MDAAKQHDWVANYNWDDGLAPIWPIVMSPQTEFATALMIYWRLDGPWLEARSDGVNDEAKQLQDYVRQRLLAGFYPRHITFDPPGNFHKSRFTNCENWAFQSCYWGLMAQRKVIRSGSLRRPEGRQEIALTVGSGIASPEHAPGPKDRHSLRAALSCRPCGPRAATSFAFRDLTVTVYLPALRALCWNSADGNSRCLPFRI
jgi:hypothetical protein